MKTRDNPLWHQARKAAETAFNLLPMPVQLQNFTREERERYVDAMGDVILMALEEAKHHGHAALRAGDSEDATHRVRGRQARLPLRDQT